MTNVNEIKNYLMENVEVVSDIVDELNSWNGCLSDLEFARMEDLDEYLSNYEPSEIVNMVHYGEFNPNDEYFQFDGYGNLESFGEDEKNDELIYCIDDIIDNLIECKDMISIFDDELFDMLEELEEEE